MNCREPLESGQHATPTTEPPKGLPQELPSFVVDDRQLRVIAPGFVFLKQALNQSQQIWLAQYALSACACGQGVHSFWARLPDGRLSPNMGDRGRVYDAIDTFPQPENIKHFALALSQMAQKHEASLPDMSPTHMILLNYATSKGMMWHADDDKNDGDNDHPIVSISVGTILAFRQQMSSYC